MKTIVQFLKKKPGLSAWQLERTVKQSLESYYTNRQPETIRSNAVTDYSLLVNLPQTGEKHGESRVKFQNLPGRWQPMITDSLERAALVENPSYQLGGPWSPADRQNLAQNNPLFDPLLEPQNQRNLLHEAQSKIHEAAASLPSCRLVASEVFLEHYCSSYVNSLGLELSLPSSKILWDFALVSADGSSEISSMVKGRFLDQLNWAQTLQTEAVYLHDLQQARLPPTGNFPVVLAEEALDSLFDYFSGQAAGAALYYRYSSFVPGQSVFGDQLPLEPLSLATDPALRGAQPFSFYDDLGFPLRKLQLIEDNILRDFAIDGRYASYLHRERSSQFSTTVVKPGQYSRRDFLESGTIEVLRFSTFHPDPVTGNFSGEIRLGYWHRHGQKIPLRGGSVSGVSQQAFLRARYSRETVQRESYFGPAAVFFENLTIAGE